jgi:hypothetical protein
MKHEFDFTNKTYKQTKTKYAKCSEKNTPVVKIIGDFLDIIDFDILNEDVSFRTITLFARTNYLLNNTDETDIHKIFIAPEYFHIAIRHFFDLISHKEYWQLVADYYIMFNPKLGAVPDEFIDLFKSGRPFKKHLMSKEERSYLKKLPETITIYRGMSDYEYESGCYRCSWTLDENIAKKFAHEFYSHSGKVMSLVIPKKEVIAYFYSREEQEIIYFHY